MTWILSYFTARIWSSLGEPVELEGAELRRMAQMASGRLVLAPAAAAPGDVIALCQGGFAPLLLQPLKNGGDIDRVEDFELVGEAYLDNLMNSSLWVRCSTEIGGYVLSKS
jgi:hypothetical protein